MPVDVNRSGSTVEVRMPAPRALSQALVVLSWVPFLAAAVVALVIAIATAVRSHEVREVAAAAFFVSFALLILAASLAGFAASLYGLLGREIAKAEDGGLTLERVLFGAKSRQHFHEVEKLRLADPPEQESRRRWASPAPKLRFESEGQSQAFGAGLTDDEACEVLRVLGEALG